MAYNALSSWEIIRRIINSVEIGGTVTKSKLREVVMYNKKQESCVLTMFNYVNLLLKNEYIKISEINGRYIILKHIDESTKVTDLQRAYDVKFDTPPLEIQIGGNHYKGYKYQPIQFFNDTKITFTQGAIIKYVMRYKDKNGIEDLEKAKHYAQLAIDLVHKGTTDKRCSHHVYRFIDENNLSDELAQILKHIFKSEWLKIIKVIDEMIKNG